MKSVLISIRPEWCGKIISGEKTLEIRKTRPKIDTPFKCYIYCTLPKRPYSDYFAVNSELIVGGGKVIGEFVCDKVTKAEKGTYYILPASETQMDVIDYVNYADEKPVYGWHISDLVIYDKPKVLAMDCEFITNKSTLTFDDNGEFCYTRLTRPPQSWCYVEEL